MIFLALAEHVHVVLAHADVSLVRLQARDQLCVETHAGVRLILQSGWLLAVLLMLLLGFGLRVSTRAATTEHRPHSRVGHLRSGAAGHP